MIEVRQTEAFASWLRDLRDIKGRGRIALRIQRLATGHAGDVTPVGGGVSELRIHAGPGYRVYFVRRGDVLIVLLCGGDKATQRKDIARAKELAESLEW